MPRNNRAVRAQHQRAALRVHRIEYAINVTAKSCHTRIAAAAQRWYRMTFGAGAAIEYRAQPARWRFHIGELDTTLIECVNQIAAKPGQRAAKALQICR